MLNTLQFTGKSPTVGSFLAQNVNGDELRYSALNKAFGMSEAYHGKGSKQKTLSNCERAKTVRMCESENCWWQTRKG